MHIYKCDICERELKNEEERVTFGHNSMFASHLACVDCGKPVLAFMKRHGLLEKEEIIQKKKKG